MKRLLFFLLVFTLAAYPQTMLGAMRAQGGMQPGPGTAHSTSGGGGGTSTFKAYGNCGSGGLTCNASCSVGTCGTGTTFAVTAGDTIICITQSTTLTSNTLSCVDNDAGGSNTYADCGPGLLPSDGVKIMQFFCAKAKATNATLTVTPTVSNSTNLMAGLVGQWTGTANIVDKFNFALNTATTSFTSGASGTTSFATETLIGIMCDESGIAFTATGGFANRGNNSDACNFIDRQVSATGSYTATATASSAATGYGVILTFQ
jgi:hypothetical protein